MELVIDNFAGGGGASTGLELALGRAVDIAINHDPAAIAMHRANHPDTKHYIEDVWAVDPLEATGGKPVGLAWFSPDCKHFSKAKGGTPVEKKIRGLAWVVLKWAAKVRPRVIMLENVEEFKGWGPVRKGKPIKSKKGQTFQLWRSQLESLGYKVESRELRACDYGAPTVRKRLFIIARCDGRPIVWPEPTHGDPEQLEVRVGLLNPWRTAAEIIDWSIPCPSIFERKKPLVSSSVNGPSWPTLWAALVRISVSFLITASVLSSLMLSKSSIVIPNPLQTFITLSTEAFPIPLSSIECKVVLGIPIFSEKALMLNPVSLINFLIISDLFIA